MFVRIIVLLLILLYAEASFFFIFYFFSFFFFFFFFVGGLGEWGGLHTIKVFNLHFLFQNASFLDITWSMPVSIDFIQFKHISSVSKRMC